MIGPSSSSKPRVALETDELRVVVVFNWSRNHVIIETPKRDAMGTKTWHKQRDLNYSTNWDPQDIGDEDYESRAIAALLRKVEQLEGALQRAQVKQEVQQ